MSTQVEDVSLAVDDRAQAQVNKELDEAFARANSEDPISVKKSLDLASGRYIVFSDLHRGARNGADDFWRTERAYNAALAYYFRKGHTLVVLGDVEELWEERPRQVLKAYEHTFKLEARFHQQGRYCRVRGNHDDEWQNEDSVKSLLVPVYGEPELRVYESLLLEVVDGEDELGGVFLVHGHQGTAASGPLAGISKLIVRYIWRPIQRLTHLSVNTPATSWRLRQSHNRMLYAWAEQQAKLILIAGHTHRPVFESQSHETQLEKQLAELEEAAKGRISPEQLEKLAALLAKLEWVRAQERERPRDVSEPSPSKPCYFNSGCCCYLDGDITGLEIAEGEIRLVRWPDEEAEPKPHILARGSLKDVLADC